MSKPIAQTVLMQLGAVMNPLLSGSQITGIRALPAGASVYGDAFTGQAKPAAAGSGTPTSILARQGLAAQLDDGSDWLDELTDATGIEACLAAMKRAEALADGKSIEAIVIGYGAIGGWNDMLQDEPGYDELVTVMERIGARALPHLVEMVKKGEVMSGYDSRMASSCIVSLSERGVDCSRAVPAILGWLEVARGPDIGEACSDLLRICGLGFKSRMIESLKRNDDRNNGFEVTRHVLRKWGLPEEEIDAVLRGEVPSEEDESLINDPMHRAAYKLLVSDAEAKRTILEGSAVLKALRDPQAWITINDPGLAREMVQLVAAKAGSKSGKLDNAVGAALGRRMKDLEDAHYTYYADEIIDAVAQFVKQTNLARDPEMQALMARMRYGDDIKLRYIRRDASDTSLGSKCGDCTSKGSIHFGDSMTWFINPAYQIIKISKGKRFIGKIHITLGSIGGADAVIIDALEFNPQAHQGKPYHEDGVTSFAEAMELLKSLARHENRQLIAMRQSNSSGAMEMLGEWGKKIALEGGNKNIGITLLIPPDEIRALLKRDGYDGEVNLYYQMLGETEHAQLNTSGRNMVDDKAPVLEREVVNPAQITDEDVASAMRVRDFERAAKHILANPDWKARIKTIFGIPTNMGISPVFLAKRLKDIYRDEAIDVERLKLGFRVLAQSFVRIPTE